MARTAVIAGTATAVSGSVQRSAAQRAADEQARRPEEQPTMVAAQAGPTAADEKIDKIRQLGKLHADGLLNDAEFSAAKASLLGI